jgi:hypothetical protein
VKWAILDPLSLWFSDHERSCLKKAVFSCYLAVDQHSQATGKDTAMNYSTALPTPSASTLDSLPADLVRHLLAHARAIADLATAFLEQRPTPATTYQFENHLAEQLQDLGRCVVEWTCNHLEPDDPHALPQQILWQSATYRRKPKSHNRSLNCLFGPIHLWRYRYEAVDTSEPAIFPLEIALGIEVERATPALAESVGQAAAAHTQGGVRELLARYHGVQWSVTVLRKVTANLSQGLAEHREAAQVAQLVEALRQASKSVGPHPPTVCLGRDGVMVPLRGSQSYAEAATGTVSVLDRRGRRIGTAYLGRMPEKEQQTLSRQLTSLLLLLMASWTGALPRWQYLTDGGQQPTAYFRQVLRYLRHPLTKVRLQWEWVIDFFHASGYLTKLGEALYGTTRQGVAWSAKMRRWLRHKVGGIQRVFYSAAAVRARKELSARAEKEYGKAWRYLQKRKRRMDYAGSKRRGLAVGSGVTEAACKTVFTQRVKQSGMRWGLEGGQVIVDLRILVLSRVWQQTHQAYLASKPQLEIGTIWSTSVKTAAKAA